MANDVNKDTNYNLSDRKDPEEQGKVTGERKIRGTIENFQNTAESDKNTEKTPGEAKVSLFCCLMVYQIS